MIVKLKKISPKPFVLISVIVYTFAGLVLGVIVAVASVAAPSEQPEGLNLGLWSIIVFPLINAMVGAFSSWLMCVFYNLLSGMLGGLEFEVDEIQK